MTDADAIIVKVLAHHDAVRLPIRNWLKSVSANRYALTALGGVPFRMIGGNDGERKSGERKLADMADAGLLTVRRGGGVKFPIVALTPAGDARARSLIGFPGRAVGRLLLAAVAEKAKKYVMSWCPEIDLNKGKGWGENATAEDRRGLSDTETDALPAIAAGWVIAHSTIQGHGAYQATKAGLAELRKPSKPPKVGRLPKYDREAGEFYRAEQDARLRELETATFHKPGEIGTIPLSVGLLLDEGTEDDDEVDDEGTEERAA